MKMKGYPGYAGYFPAAPATGTAGPGTVNGGGSGTPGAGERNTPAAPGATYYDYNGGAVTGGFGAPTRADHHHHQHVHHAAHHVHHSNGGGAIVQAGNSPLLREPYAARSGCSNYAN
jgi:hypothetical protein